MRYIIGIDLGTTNSCAAYIDTQDPKLAVKAFRIPQIVSIGRIEALPTLPSFAYLPSVNEFPSGSCRLPWDKASEPDVLIGDFAKQQGAKTPTRLVQSAKSWLCHSAASRRDRILPIEAADESQKMSPVEASARYLAHIRNAWDHLMAKEDDENRFEMQEIMLTVPASFDEVARTLTIEAAKKAGFSQITLLEEPQAAFYSWIAQHEGMIAANSSCIKPGMKIFVCDVGGGTTDFSLIETLEEKGGLSFRRISVGDHLLLGGDNMDRAIAHFLEEKLGKKKIELSTAQQRQLLHEARTAKEILLSSEKDIQVPIILHGSGSQVVKGTVSTELTSGEVKELLLKGFLGSYSWEEALKFQRISGFRSMGLPYENEPSIVKHMARFLADHQAKPDFILFNGGALKPRLFQEALIHNLNTWFREGNPSYLCQSLDSYHLDLAVARGAAYFGKTRRGLGVKIGGGLPRSYYLMLETASAKGNQKKALTIMARGSEEGTAFEPPTTFMLTPNTPVSFQLAASHIRLSDSAGDLVTPDQHELQFLPPIHTILKFGKKMHPAPEQQEKIPVRLQVYLTPIGTLEVSLKALHTEHKWALEFQLRTASGQDNQMGLAAKAQADQTFDLADLAKAESLMEEMFRSAKPLQLIEKLEACLGMAKRDWPPSVMRRLADVLLKLAPQRKASAAHAERWWNLVGFLLRPGFGYPLDDFRMKELWKVILTDFKLPMPQELQLQLWICYRRISGGLSKGQQMQLASDIQGTLWNKRNGSLEAGAKGDFYAYSEKMRTLASFELLDMPFKQRIGDALVARILSGNGAAIDYWALGRIGARHLFYGSMGHVISPEKCEEWIERLLEVADQEKEYAAFLFEQLARKTEHRELNIRDKYLEKIMKKYESTVHYERLKECLLTERRLTQQEQDSAFGEHLPAGLMLTLEE